MKQLLMGNEAIAAGALAAGVSVVTGYPGTPSTEVLETVAKRNPGHVYVEWSTNEKVALEVAAGAAYAGARSLVTMKQVGLNVASDPLMSLSYVGVKGGMVVLVADDPGPISSQTEQDTRHFAQYANLPVFDPQSPEQAYEMVQAAFELSERLHTPVLLRPTTRVCHSCAVVDVAPPVTREAEGFIKDSKWVIFPRLAAANKLKNLARNTALEEENSHSPFNTMAGSGTLGIACAGFCAGYVQEALQALGMEATVLTIGTPHPFPLSLAQDFLGRVERVLVVEELDPMVEDALRIAQAGSHTPVPILGKRSGHLPCVGEYSEQIVAQALRALLGQGEVTAKPLPTPPPLAVRPPVLCAGCPHRGSFYAVKQALKGQRAVFCGDIGCYTLGNALPLDMVDTCLCMGAGITVAQGLHRVEGDVVHAAFVGDSTFFHTGIPGVVNALYNGTDLLLVVLDNGTTAMTGQQPHPGIGKTMMDTISARIDIAGVLTALGVEEVAKADAFNLPESVTTVKRLAALKGVRAVIFEGACIAIAKKETPLSVTDCKNCKRCLNELGCPALSQGQGTVAIDGALCTGCGLCAQVCPFACIGGGAA